MWRLILLEFNRYSFFGYLGPVSSNSDALGCDPAFSELLKVLAGNPTNEHVVI